MNSLEMRVRLTKVTYETCVFLDRTKRDPAIPKERHAKPQFKGDSRTYRLDCAMLDFTRGGGSPHLYAWDVNSYEPRQADFENYARMLDREFVVRVTPFTSEKEPGAADITSLEANEIAVYRADLIPQEVVLAFGARSPVFTRGKKNTAFGGKATIGIKSCTDAARFRDTTSPLQNRRHALDTRRA